MADTKMESLRLAHTNVPRFLYLIDYPGSRTRFQTEMGIAAADTDTLVHNFPVEEFHKSIADHFDRKSKVPSPYISLFSDRNLADNLASYWVRRCNVNHSDVATVVEIDTFKLRGSYFFHSRCLIEKLDLRDVIDAVDRSEYLCLHHIPAWAIVSRRYTKHEFLS